MTSDAPTNLPASVRQRLLNLSRERGEDFNYVLTRFGNERLLYRLARSEHRDQFVLKGATLFETWSERPHRATRDIDLLGFGDAEAARIEDIFRELCSVEVVADGLQMLEESVRAEEIREHQEYGGVRVRLTADLDGAQISLQVDIGFGDAVTPGVEEADFPALLEFPAPNLRMYPRETVVAEKFEALVRLGIFNTRMKDFYDLWSLSRLFSFDGALLSRAIAATFERRGSVLPVEAPTALGPEFSDDATKQRQWSAFLQRAGLEEDATLADIASALRDFLLPPSSAAAAGKSFARTWAPGGGWLAAT